MMPVFRVSRTIEWVEAAIAVASLAVAAWQLCVLEPSLWFTALFWWLPSAIALYISFRGTQSMSRRIWAVLYLLLLSLGTYISTQPELLPGFTARHQGATEFADIFNKLELTSRRLITWNMVIAGASMFFWTGYCALWKDLIVHLRHEGIPRLSLTTCVLGLAVVWGIGAFLLVFSLGALIINS